MNVRKPASDLVAVTLAASLFTTSTLVGFLAYDKETLALAWPPMFGHWEPHLGPGTPAVLIVAGLVAGYGPQLARRLAWRPLLGVTLAASLAWVWSLALIDGWERGVTRVLTYGAEYLTVLDGIDGIGPFLDDFTDGIPDDSPTRWPAHVAGHPPGATLTFVWLERIGLGGGAWAAVLCIVLAASAAVAVLITVRAVAGEELARRAAPFTVLVPGAVWMGVSADGYFTGVAAWAVALLALAAHRSGPARWAVSFASGLLFGWLLYLSYGLVLMGTVALAVLVLTRGWRTLPWALAGIVAVVVAFTAAGFWWFDGYFELVDRYYAVSEGYRPYVYFVWANLAVQVLTVGLATVAGLGRLPAAFRKAGQVRALVVLVAAGLMAMLAADVSGMSKAETERIWLPFVVWLVPAAALLPARHARWWLVAQAVVAIVVNHLWLTRW